MATTAKKVDKITLGPILSARDQQIAMDEIRARINLIIESLNQIIADLNV